MSSAVYAEEGDRCWEKWPRVVRAADFGRIEIGSDARCADKPDDLEGGCDFIKNGVTYGITHGYIVSKEIRRGAYSGKMPFNLNWGDDFAVVERRIKAMARRGPVFKPSTSYDGEQLIGPEGGYCLLTRRDRNQYTMYFLFDKQRKLVAIEATAPFD